MPGRKERYQQPTQEFQPKAVVEQGIEQLLAEIQQGKSERLEQYLRFTARFHRYSTQNQILIHLQCPNAQYVAGYRAWQEMGYQVAKGAKGIRILAPRLYKHHTEENEEEVAVWFATISVFDASQLANLDQKPLPAFFTPLADDQYELYDRLAQIVAEDGITITEQQTGLTQGYSAGGRIVLKEGLDSTNKALTLIHEYAHELLHKSTEGRAQDKRVKECHAEAVSYVVAHHFGLYNPYSSDYLQNWGNTTEELLAELEIIRQTAARIIDRLEDSPSLSKSRGTRSRISSVSGATDTNPL